MSCALAELAGVGRIHDAVRAQVRRTPDRVAVVAGDRRITYAGLDDLSDRVAAELHRRGVRAGSLVGICLGRDDHLVAALLGVLKSGAAYVPLDPAYPEERLRFIAADSGLRHVVTSTPWLRRAELTGAEPVLTDALPPGAPPAGTESGDLAYVIYTSGSTGTPKGVAIEHRNTLGLVAWALETYSPEELAGTLGSTSVCFDVSVAEFYPPLVSGGTLIMADNLLALPTLPARDEVTMLNGVPSVLAALARTPLPPNVHTVTAAGEALTRALTDRLYANPGVRRVVNAYGPTECTTYCSADDVPRDEPGEPSIGRSLAGALLTVRDADGAEVPEGAAGELWVGGPVVARGYLNRPELTAERFVSGPGGRAYRTGDLVRRMGEVFHYLGRQDHQVKVRGFRIELGEVEAALAGHPGVSHAVVLAPPGADGVRQLIGYAEAAGHGGPAERPTEPELRAYLRARLPDYMVPTRIVVLDRIPVGPTGKADRAALPAPDAGRPDIEYVAPRTDTERRIAAVVADVLGLPRVGALDRFGESGGHSLAAARVVARVNEEFGRAVPLATFLLDPTAAGLAAALDATDRAGETTLARHEGRTEFPPTVTQRDFWTLRQVLPDAAAIGVGVRLRIRGLAGAAPLRAALDAIVVRHEALRTVFEERPGGPVAVVRPPAPVPFEEHDLRDLPVPARTERAAELAQALADRPFDAGRDVPLVRASLQWLGPDTGELAVLADHAVADGWSVATLMDELAAGIEAARAGRPVDTAAAPPPVQVGDLGVYEHDLAARQDRDALFSFWRRELAGVIPPHDLPALPASPDPTAASVRLTRPFPAELAERVRDFAAASGTTPFATYLAALKVIVAGLTGRPDVLLGAVTALRFRPGVDRVIGPLVDVLPVRADLSDDPPFRAVVSRTAGGVTRALTHQGLTGTELAVASGTDVPRGDNFLPVQMSMQPETLPVVVERGATRIDLCGELGTGASPTALTVFVNATVDGPQLQVDYWTDRFDEPMCQALMDRLLTVLDTGLADPDRPLSTFELVGPDERAALLAAGTGVDLPADLPASVIPAVLEHAAIRPEAVAVASPAGKQTYRELAETSARVAAALVDRGATGGTVALCLPRDHFIPTAMLGILRSGAAYLPLDPDHPAERLRLQVTDAGTTLAVGAGATLPVLRAVPGLRVLDLTDLTAHPMPGCDLPEVGARAVAYLLYTSGSTGRPKGVEVTHGNLAAFAEAMRREPGLGPDDVVLAVSALTFDVSGFDLWAPLYAGGQSYVVDRDTALDGQALIGQIDAAGVTAAKVTPTALRILVSAGWSGRPGMRVFSIGEPLDPALAREVLPRVAELWNVYGPTETTITSTVYRVREVGGETVAVGRPCDGERAYVLDRWGRLVPPGVTGDLWIGGAGVARGYRGQPDLTAAAFTDDPLAPGQRRYRTGDLARWSAGPGGYVLEFLGRRDHQVKVRGHRIELGEIETVLRDHPAVRDTVVRVVGTGGDAHLVGYVVWRDGSELPGPPGSTALLEEHARTRVPEYMVPRRWVELAAFPMLASGKVDRRALPEPGVPDRVPTEPRTAMEQFVAEVWAEVLGVDAVGAYDDFFALGGHSFSAIQVILRLRDALGCDVPVRILFDRPVLAEFAEQVEQVALSGLAAQVEA